MELAGLKRAMGFLKDHVNIKTLVTDRHSMVKKYMKDCHAEKIITLMFGTLQKVIQVNAFLYILRFLLSLYLHNPLLLLYFTKVSLRNLKQHQKTSAVSKFDLVLSLLLTIVTGQLHQVKMMVN